MEKRRVVLLMLLIPLAACSARQDDLLGPAEAGRDLPPGRLSLQSSGMVMTVTPDTVSPVLPGRWDAKLPLTDGTPASTDLYIQVTDGTVPGVPVEDLEVSLEAQVRVYSGGHMHDDDRPQGVFLVDQTSNDYEFVYNGPDSTLVMRPDANGEIRIPYRTSGVGGEEVITAYAQQAGTQACVAAPAVDSLSVHLRVRPLFELPEASHLDLIGETGTHPDNHFGVISVIVRVDSIARRFHASGLGPLEVNDMSLEAGGIFDCGQPDTPGCKTKNSWGPPHQTHRRGTNVDFGVPYNPADPTSERLKIWVFRI